MSETAAINCSNRVRTATVSIEDFRLADGTSARLKLAYSKTGPEHAPAYLILHGYAGSHHALDPRAQAADAGWASAWVGPGRCLDTEICQVLTVNLPGSAYGSEWEGGGSHASIPEMAHAIRGLLGQLGVERLAGVIGYSFGGYVALQLKASHPVIAGPVLGLCTAWKGRGKPEELNALRALETPAARFAFREQVLLRSGMQAWVNQKGSGARQVEYARLEQWSREFTAEALCRLRAAAIEFDLGGCPPDTQLFYASTDALFPAPMPLPPNARVIDTPFGHQSLIYDPAAWIPALHEWIRSTQHQFF